MKGISMVSLLRYKDAFLRMLMFAFVGELYFGNTVQASRGHESYVGLQDVDPARLPNVRSVFFPQTSHHLSNRAGFLDFWRANGQLTIFGYPITEEIIEKGRVVQYFERARFEYHPENSGTNNMVQLSLLGRQALDLQPRSESPSLEGGDGGQYFSETGFRVSGEFLRFWERWGGLPIFGYPISETRVENGRKVQYFERARLIHQPEDMGLFYRQMEAYNGINLNTLYEVISDDLGRQFAARQNLATAPVAQRVGAATWSPGLWNRRIEISLSRQWLTAYEDNLVVYRAPVATGKDGFNTPTGQYAVYDKLLVQTMIGSEGGETWYVPDIPWVMYFVGGVALHGTYWHDQFGTGARMSHGCVNLGMDDAQWLYQWTDLGVPVIVYD